MYIPLHVFDLLGSQGRGRFCPGLGLIPPLNHAARVRVRSLPNIKVETSNPATVQSQGSIDPSETPFITGYLLIYIVCRYSLPVASLVHGFGARTSGTGFGYSWMLAPSLIRVLK